ncbi:MAG: transglutaminase domain-containing protein, partial [Planctomycetes bacterium]|nr:transglutaminase domain-containing protein [Planctomycetota bacterium]
LLPSPTIIKDVNAAKEITYHLQPVNTETLNIPVTDNQTVRKDDKGNTLVTVKPLKAAAGQKIPYSGKDAKILKAMMPNMYVQSNDPVIITLAETAVNGSTDAIEVARKIEKFVYDYIDEKNLAVGYATASEVASSKQGDCSEHAVLTAAMCQAVGIPAQVVTGLLYVDNFAGKDNIFGPHAWVQVYIGGKWIGLDATRAEQGFNAGYIALAAGDGNPEGFFSMVNTLGYFKIVAIEQK